MPKKKKPSTEHKGGSSIPLNLHQRLREGFLILTVALSIFLLLALITYHRSDPAWSHWVNSQKVANAGGRVGAWVADIFLYLFGYLAYLFPVMLSYLAWLFYRNHSLHGHGLNAGWFVIGMRVMGFVLILLTGSGLATLDIRIATMHLPFSSGGILGNLIGLGMLHTFNWAGTSLILIAILLIGITLFTDLSWLRLLETVGVGAINGARWLGQRLRSISWQQFASIIGSIKRKQTRQDKPIINKPKPQIKRAAISDEPANPFFAELQKDDDNQDDFAKTIDKTSRNLKSNVLPHLSLLDSPPKGKSNGLSTQELEARSQEVESRLADFGVQVKVVAVHPGPVVTRYELQLAAGTKVSKITGLAKDLARSLSVVSVRVVEVIPGKSVIGIELPNPQREMVTLQEVLASQQYQNARSALTLALGKDIAGHPVIVDLAKMPHLLVAGTTGSGKSVNLNAMLLSLLYKSTPKRLRLILIDPKMLELAVYDGIPHLLAPVVTDMKDAASALRWCVVEMERRYRLMAPLGVRNIAGYNAKVSAAKEQGKPLLNPIKTAENDESGQNNELEELPQIVVLADEFADMMVVVGKKVETLIARLAQKARAAGVHLIFATQRPSVDVITGLIKANIPTRIAFQVSSKVDSRTILDQQGADQLLGHGDMLYLAPGTGVPVRVHGAYVSDEEVHRVVGYLKENGRPDYLDEILNESVSVDPTGYTEAASGEFDAEQDSLYDQAVDFITQARRVSVSSIQRRFKIGYNRAARITESMEAAGVISKMEGNGQREVLAPPPVSDG